MPEKEYTFKFTELEVNIVLNALGDLSYKTVYGLINKIQQTVTKQKTEESKSSIPAETV